MRYTRTQRKLFVVLTLVSAAAVAMMIHADVPGGWLIVYATLLPVAFRLLILAGDRADPTKIPGAIRVWRAMRLGQVVLYWQPKVSGETGELVGAEALARWEHPTRGTLRPVDWIESTSLPWLERRFCCYVLELGISQAAEWHSMGEGTVVCVNVAPCCFAQPWLATSVSNLLERHELPARCLCIELTEAALDLSEEALEMAARLKELGVLLALDDFGVGHSSLSRLARVPVDELKIDRQFIAELTTSPRHRAVVQAALRLAGDLGMTSVAEGVETPADRNSLQGLGCDVLQGYLFGAAMPADELASWRRTRPEEREGRFISDVAPTPRR